MGEDVLDGEVMDNQGVVNESVFDTYADVDPDVYDFSLCLTASDPIGPIYPIDVFAALSKSGGNINGAARLINRRRNDVKRWLDANPEFYQVTDDAVQGNLDDLEQGIMQAALAGDQADRRYLLDRLGKNRGYTTKSEVSGTVNHIVNVMSDNVTTTQLERVRKYRAKGGNNG